MLATAGAFEDENGKIALHFLEIAPVPVTQFPLLVEECNSAPLAGLIYQFGTLDRLGTIENTLKVSIPESAKDCPQLKEKPPAVLLRVIRTRYRLLTLHRPL